MTTSPNFLPDITHPDVSIILVSRWYVGAPERQQATADAAIAEWEHLQWPEALLSFNTFVSTDGDTVLSYAQWTNDKAHREFMRIHHPTLARISDDAVADLEPAESVRYRLYRSHVSDSAPRRPGCIVIVSIKADGPERARQWVDTVIDALNTKPHTGMISAHFHVSADGTQILNYAEWIDEQAHRDAIEDRTPLTPEWRRVQNMPGMKHLGFKRYHLHHGLSKPLT